MTHDRGRLHALKTLIDLQGTGGFTLPPELLTAATLPEQVGAQTLPEPPVFGEQQAADAVLYDLQQGRTLDLDSYAAKVLDSQAAGQRRERSLQILQATRELAVTVAVNAAADFADHVVTTTLRPAFDDTLAQSARCATALHGHPLDHRALITAPAKVRTAWLELQGLADRYSAIRQARTAINTAGLRAAEHDGSGEFAHLHSPHTLTGYKLGAGRPPRVDQPTDPVDLMLWLTSPGQAGKPWLPTMAEQDARWLEVYGDAQTMRRNAAVFGRSVGARGGGPLTPTAA